MPIDRSMTMLKLIVASTLLTAGVNGIRGEVAETAAPPAKRAFAVCELYAPGHFGNSYEVLGPNEMHQVLEEARFWGFNRYGDWFDMDDCKDPFGSGHTYGLDDALWDAKKVNYGSAQGIFVNILHE